MTFSRRQLSILSALVLCVALMASACRRSSDDVAPQPTTIELTNIADLRAVFNADRGKVRVVVLLEPG